MSTHRYLTVLMTDSPWQLASTNVEASFRRCCNWVTLHLSSVMPEFRFYPSRVDARPPAEYLNSETIFSFTPDAHILCKSTNLKGFCKLKANIWHSQMRLQCYKCQGQREWVRYPNQVSWRERERERQTDRGWDTALYWYSHGKTFSRPHCRLAGHKQPHCFLYMQRFPKLGQACKMFLRQEHNVLLEKYFVQCTIQNMLTKSLLAFWYECFLSFNLGVKRPTKPTLPVKCRFPACWKLEHCSSPTCFIFF